MIVRVQVTDREPALQRVSVRLMIEGAAAAVLSLAATSCLGAAGDVGEIGATRGNVGSGTSSDAQPPGTSVSGDDDDAGGSADSDGSNGTSSTEGGTGDPPRSACGEPPPQPADCGDGVLEDVWVHIGTGATDERDSLDGVREIQGNLIIHGAADDNLDFLACIEEITGNLIVSDNDALVCMTGLANLETLGGNLVVAGNDALVEIDAPVGVTTIGTSVVDGVGEVDHSVLILDNPSLRRIGGLTALAAIAGELHIQRNAALEDIDGLVGIEGIGGNLAINHNSSLCMSAIVELGEGIEVPATPPDDWTTVGDAEGC